MSKNSFLFLKKFKNTESAQLWSQHNNQSLSEFLASSSLCVCTLCTLCRSTARSQFSLANWTAVLSL